MRKENSYHHYGADEQTLFDADGKRVEVEKVDGLIQLYGWTIYEDTRGRPVGSDTGKLNLTRLQGIELARRLLAVASE